MTTIIGLLFVNIGLIIGMWALVGRVEKLEHKVRTLEVLREENNHDRPQTKT